MPYKLTWEKFGVCRHYFGDVSIVERRTSFDEICGDWRFDNLRYTITDYLPVRRYEVTDSATLDIAALHIAPLITNPRILIAAVATRADIVAAIGEMQRYGFMKAPYRVFASVDEARRWIREGVSQ